MTEREKHRAVLEKFLKPGVGGPHDGVFWGAILDAMAEAAALARKQALEEVAARQALRAKNTGNPLEAEIYLYIVGEIRALIAAEPERAEPTPEQMRCGRCLYGPPALCTCGTCPPDPEAWREVPVTMGYLRDLFADWQDDWAQELSQAIEFEAKAKIATSQGGK